MEVAICVARRSARRDARVLGAMTSSPLNVVTERTPQGFVVRLRGELDATNCDDLRAVFDVLLGSGPQDIDVDMSELTFADWAGASVLMSAHNRLAGREQKLTLVAPRPIVRRLLAVTGLDELLPISEPAGQNDDPQG